MANDSLINTDEAFKTAFAGNDNTDQAFNQAFAQDKELSNPAIVPTQQAPAAQLPSQINVINPEGKLVSIASSQLEDAMKNGYRPATEADTSHHFKEEKFGSLGQKALGFAEGAAEGASFGLSGQLENELSGLGVPGVTPEERLSRREINPGSHQLGEMAGLIGSAFIPGVGEANVLKAAGEMGAKAIGLGAAESLAGKIGSGAVKGAIETMMVSGGDEVSKMLAKDPNQSVETAVTDIGLGGLLGAGIGGAFGAIPPLWKATSGGKTGSILQAISNKVGGIEGVESNVINQAIQTSGMDIAPEIKAALESNPEVRHIFQTLQESATGSGIKAQEALKQFKADASNALVSALGKTPEDVGNLASMSEYEAGDGLKKALVDKLSADIEPISKKFEAIKSRYADTELPQLAKSDMATRIGEMANTEGFNLSPSAPQAKLITRVLEEIPGLKTLEDVRKYSSVVGDSTTNPELWRVGSQLRKILRGVEEDVLDKTLGEEAPELLAQHAEARGAYKKAMETIDSLNDRLHVGRYAGPDSFSKALREMAPEDVLRRLSPKGDAGIIGELQAKFPEASEQLKDYHISQLLKGAANRAGEGETINSKILFNNLSKMSPEMRNYLINPENTVKMEAIKELLSGLPSKMNTSGTAKTIDSLWSSIPGSAVAIASMLGKGASKLAEALIIGPLIKTVSRDVPDAVRLQTLKFLGSNKEISSGGFKAGVDYLSSVIKGENLTGRAIKNVFKAGSEVLPQSVIPSEKDRTRLDKKLKELQVDNSPLLNVGGETAHYHPEAGSAMGQFAANAVNYLNSIRPGSTKLSPLDKAIAPSPLQKAEYDKALNIAQQPLSILNSIKNGTITPSDVKHLQNIYPNLYNKLVQKITEQVADASEKDKEIPYKTKIGLSMFMAQPLDSTMTPNGILSIQSTFVSKDSQQNQQVGQSQQLKPANSTTKLSKLPSMYQTPSQASEAHRAQKS